MRRDCDPGSSRRPDALADIGLDGAKRVFVPLKGHSKSSQQTLRMRVRPFVASKQDRPLGGVVSTLLRLPIWR